MSRLYDRLYRLSEGQIKHCRNRLSKHYDNFDRLINQLANWAEGNVESISDIEDSIEHEIGSLDLPNTVKNFKEAESVKSDLEFMVYTHIMNR